MKIQIDIENTRSCAVTISDGITKETKSMSFTNLIHILQRAIDQEEKERVTITKYPSCCVYASIAPADKLTGEFILYVEPMLQNIDSTAMERDMIPFPALLLLAKVRNGRVIGSMVFACKEKSQKTVNLDTPIFNFPYSNVFMNGNICWGGNRLPEIESLNELPLLLTCFINAKSNRDLYRPGVSCKLDIPLEKLYSYIKELEEFDNELLVPCGTVNNALNTLLNQI